MKSIFTLFTVDESSGIHIQSAKSKFIFTIRLPASPDSHKRPHKNYQCHAEVLNSQSSRLTRDSHVSAAHHLRKNQASKGRQRGQDACKGFVKLRAAYARGKMTSHVVAAVRRSTRRRTGNGGALPSSPKFERLASTHIPGRNPVGRAPQSDKYRSHRAALRFHLIIITGSRMNGGAERGGRGKEKRRPVAEGQKARAIEDERDVWVADEGRVERNRRRDRLEK